MYNFWSFFVKKSSFSFLLLIALIGFGFYAVLTIPKESAPEVQVPIAIISTPFPGSSALDVEELVTNKIEEQLNSNLDELKKITSTSREGVSIVIAEFNANLDIDKSIDKVRDEIDKIKPELPSDAEDPIISDVDFVDQPILLISVASDLPVTEFIKLTNDVIDELKKVKGVSRIQKSGIREAEVQVVVRKDALKKFGINLPQIVLAIAKANNSLPVGSVQIGDIEYAVRFEGDIDNPSEIKDIAILNSSGEPVYIRDIAFVSDGVSKSTSFSRVSINGEPLKQAVSLSVFKKRGGDITVISDAVKDRLKELDKTLLKDAESLVAFDVGKFVKDDLRNLSLTGAQTVVLVMIILFISIGWKESLIAGSAIPLSFLAAFIALQITGNTINFVSLFSLILAVGILVDSSIVITEGMHTKIRSIPDKKEAAFLTIREFYLPLTSGTMTTIAVFAPLLFLSGVTGQFIASIPFTIIFVLLASLFIALGMIPLLSKSFLNSQRNNGSRLRKTQDKYTGKLQNWYKRKISLILERRKWQNRFMFLLVVLFIISLALPITGVVKVIFFPPEDVDFIFIEIEKPEGSILGATDKSVREVEEILIQNRDIESFVTTVGQSSSFTGGPGTGGGSGARLANITVLLDENSKRTSFEIVRRIRQDLNVIQSAEVKVSGPQSGPPTGQPITFRFLGDDLNELELVSVRVEKLLEEIKGTVNVSRNNENGGAEFVFKINRAKASELGIDASFVGQVLRTAIFGSKATTLKTQGDDIDVQVKLDLNPNFINPHDTNRTNIDAILHTEINTPVGTVLLGSLLESYVEKSTPAVSHEDRKRLAIVGSDLEDGFIAGDIVKEFLSRQNELEIPDSVELKIGGEQEEVNRSFLEMFIALIVGLLLIVSILVLQFNKYRQAFFIIIIVPFTLIGILTGLAITGKTLSFPSMMGFIALSGIVVNNSIILIDKMNAIRKDSPYLSIKDVVLEASVLRLRPILLTTLTTVIGIIPLTYASELWSPLAFSIIFGLSFAAFITLILIPVLYYRWPGRI